MGFILDQIIKFAIFPLIPLFGCWIFGYGVEKNMYPWFNELNQPTWAPSLHVFPVVWMILYFAMGHASYRVWMHGKGFSGIARTPLILYSIKLLVLWTWSQVFFNFHLIGAATFHKVVMAYMVYKTGTAFYKVDKVAGYLFVPYMAWVTFTTFYTYTVWTLN